MNQAKSFVQGVTKKIRGAGRRRDNKRNGGASITAPTRMKKLKDFLIKNAENGANYVLEHEDQIQQAIDSGYDFIPSESDDKKNPTEFYVNTAKGVLEQMGDYGVR